MQNDQEFILNTLHLWTEINLANYHDTEVWYREFRPAYFWSLAILPPLDVSSATTAKYSAAHNPAGCEGAGGPNAPTNRTVGKISN